MPRRNLHLKPFDESTQEKLGLFRDYIREWLPVFIRDRYGDAIQVFDFFAGPGKDVEGNPGSPLITCDEIRTALNGAKEEKSPQIRVFFNECDDSKYRELSKFIEEKREEMPSVSFEASNHDFPTAFEKWLPKMKGRFANLLFLDQSGVKQITENVFKTISGLPRTDFIFFISSAIINRFKGQQGILDSLPVTEEDCLLMNGTNVHRVVTDAYRRWLPQDTDYFLGPFSIQKGPNVYGLVFGSGHPLGIDKFLKLAWKRGGEANFDIDRDGIDPSQPSLFSEYDKPSKIKSFEKELASALLAQRLKTNKDIYLFTLKNGVLASHAKDALKQMVKGKKLPAQVFHVSYGAWKKATAETIKHFEGV